MIGSESAQVMEVQAMKVRWKVRTLFMFAAVVAVLLSLAVRDSQKVFARDIISVEVASALPGKPISGTRLVRPDGTMSLGYYGKIEVAGLTPYEIRRAVAVHLRQFLPDDTRVVSVGVVRVNSRRPNLIDWLTGRIQLKDVKTFL
jgi:protein involved in polysaccharide export with SLBB domain